MRKLQIEPQPKTPKVVWDAESYTFLVEGRSIPEDSISFYRKLYNWLEAYGNQLTGHIDFEFKLEYFNTSSSKCLLDLFKMIQEVWRKNPKVKIKWYFDPDDPDMAETGNDYQALLEVPFEIIEMD